MTEQLHRVTDTSVALATPQRANVPPSPLNGERVGVRGGKADGSLAQKHQRAFVESALVVWKDIVSVSPLTLTLSPLRGEGTAIDRGQKFGGSPVRAHFSGMLARRCFPQTRSWSRLHLKGTDAWRVSPAFLEQHFPDAARGFASPPKWFRERNGRLSIDDSRSGASECCAKQDTRRARHRAPAAPASHVARRRVRDNNGPQRNKSPESTALCPVGGGICKRRISGLAGCSRVSFPPKWTYAATRVAVRLNSCEDADCMWWNFQINVVPVQSFHLRHDHYR